MSANVLFSIVVPVYRAQEYLPSCMKSLLAQTYRNVEIILVDDGSPDGCPQLCDMYAAQDARVRVIHKENGGPSDARNMGIEAAVGEYVVFVDADDHIDPDACEQLIPFTQLGCDIVVVDGVDESTGKILAHGNIEKGKICTGAQYLKLGCPRNAMLMATWLYVYRRGFLQQTGLRYKKGILHEDEHFISRAFLAAERVTESGACYYHYELRDGSITNAKDLRRNAVDFYTVCQELYAIYQTLEDRELKAILMDSLAVKYLSLFQRGGLHRYGRTYVHSRFLWNTAKRPKTRCKVLLHCVSPRLYWYINDRSKRAAQQ